MSSRVLVLGATGTIGRATVRALLAQGKQEVSLRRLRAHAPVKTVRKGLA